MMAKTKAHVAPGPRSPAAPTPSSAIAPTGPMSPIENAAASVTLSSRRSPDAVPPAPVVSLPVSTDMCVAPS